MFRAIRHWRLGRRPFPPAWEPWVGAHFPFVRKLSPELQRKFRRDLKIFCWDKHFFGAGGLKLTEKMKVVVSGSAARLILGLDLSFYDRLTEIILYPSTYQERGKPEEARLGEAQDWGTVVLSWDAVQHGWKNAKDGHNTALHEFAHVLDRADGAFDGTPPLHRMEHYVPWVSVLEQRYFELKKNQAPVRKVLDAYGATNEAEFFAVATESFYERPRSLKRNAPDLFEQLVAFYRFDPLAPRAKN